MEKVLVILFGLTLGSFLNVVIHRLPRGESLVRPGSHCPRCRAPIPWYRNLPLLTFLLQRGRCASCRGRIRLRYPLVEAVTALSFLLCRDAFGLTVHAAFAALFLCVLIALALIDLEHQILPDSLTLGGAAVFLAYSFVNPRLGPLEALLGGVGAALVFYLLFVIYLKVRRIEGLGMGDVKMMLLLGAFLGVERLITAVFLASLSGLLVGLWFIVFRRKTLRFALPFGTFLALGATVSLFWGHLVLGLLQSPFR